VFQSDSPGQRILLDNPTLQAVDDWTASRCITGRIAVYAGPVRLIDNITYLPKG
jgi:hypothetical protein